MKINKKLLNELYSYIILCLKKLAFISIYINMRIFKYYLFKILYIS